jgi:hypothetical protein
MEIDREHGLDGAVNGLDGEAEMDYGKWNLKDGEVDVALEINNEKLYFGVAMDVEQEMDGEVEKDGEVIDGEAEMDGEVEMNGEMNGGGGEKMG